MAYASSSNPVHAWDFATDAESPAGLLAEERLGHGMWPRSLGFWAVSFYVALFIIRPWERLEPWLGEIRFERTYALTMILAVLLTRGIRLRFDGVSLAVYAFFVAVCISAALAWSPELALHGDGCGLYGYATVAVMFVMLMSVIRTPYELVFMVACYIVAMWLYLAKNLWEFFLHGHGQYADGMVRLQGIDLTYGHPNDLAVSIVVSLPMAVFLYGHRADFYATWPRSAQRAFTLGLQTYFMLAATSIVLTYSRTGVVATLAFLAICTLRGGNVVRKLVKLGSGLALVLVVWLALSSDLRDRFESIWNPAAAKASFHDSAMGRIEGFWAGIEMFRRFPISGVGIGNFITYRQFHVDGVALASHNLYGQILGQTGLLGGISFALLVWLMWRNARRIQRAAGSEIGDSVLTCLHGLSCGVRDTLLLLLITGFFAHTAYRFNWLWAAAFTALAMSLTNRRLLDLEMTEPVERSRDERGYLPCP